MAKMTKWEYLISNVYVGAIKTDWTLHELFYFKLQFIESSLGPSYINWKQWTENITEFTILRYLSCTKDNVTKACIYYFLGPVK